MKIDLKHVQENKTKTIFRGKQAGYVTATVFVVVNNDDEIELTFDSELPDPLQDKLKQDIEISGQVQIVRHPYN